jgi:hypothetical protein
LNNIIRHLANQHFTRVKRFFPVSPIKLTRIRIFSNHLGAFFAPQKTGLSGGFVAAHGHLRWPRPSNPLRGWRYRKSKCGVLPEAKLQKQNRNGVGQKE